MNATKEYNTFYNNLKNFTKEDIIQSAYEITQKKRFLFYVGRKYIF